MKRPKYYRVELFKDNISVGGFVSPTTELINKRICAELNIPEQEMLEITKNLDEEKYNKLLAKVKELIPEGSSISWGGSASIRDTGVTTLLKNGNYQVFDRDDVNTNEDKVRIYRQAFECDWYLGSVNAISEDGVIVNIDGNGNRVAAMTWGPTHVLLVVGMNKVCQDVDAAIKRARSEAAPVNMARFDFNTPCQHDGCCHDCKSPDSICNYVMIQRMSHPAGRHIVILVDEILGY